MSRATLAIYDNKYFLELVAFKFDIGTAQFKAREDDTR